MTEARRHDLSALSVLSTVSALVIIPTVSRRPRGAERGERRGPPRLRLALEHDEHDGRGSAETAPITPNAWRVPSFRRKTTPDTRSSPRSTSARTRDCSSRLAEHTERVGDPQQLGGGIVAEQSGERAVGGERGSVGAEEAEAHRRRIEQHAELFLGQPQRVLHPAAGGHGLAEVGDLLSQTRHLVDQVLLGAVLVSHGRD